MTTVSGQRRSSGNRDGHPLHASAGERRRSSAGLVVVGVDGSEQSADALALALTLAEPLGASLSPVFVHPAGPLTRPLRESRYEELATQPADSMQRRMRRPGLPPALRTLQTVRHRSPAVGLEKAAEEQDATLIVVGGSSRSRLGRVLPGGTGERLLAGARCPVAIAPRGYARRADGIVFAGVAFDGSHEARNALDWAAGLARALPAQLRLLAVNHSVSPVTVPAAGLPLGSLNRKLRDELARELTETEAAVRGSGLEVAGALLDGDAAAELAKATIHLDLLVLGSRGRGPVGAVMLGSVSNALVRTATCPVVVVPRSVNARWRAEHRDLAER